MATESENIIISPGGKKISPLPANEIKEIFNGLYVAPQVLVAAEVIMDQLHIMDNGIISYRSKTYSREIVSFLEYYRIQSHDLEYLIFILKHYGYDKLFFALASGTYNDGLREYLLNNGISNHEIFINYEEGIWDIVGLSAGIVLGCGYSAASIIEVLPELPPLVADGFLFLLEYHTSPLTASLKTVLKVKEIIGGFLDWIVSDKSLTDIPKEKLDLLEKEFGDAMMERDYFRVGFIVGKLFGDVIQMYFLIEGIAKLPGMTIKMAKKYGPIFIAGARNTAKAISNLAELLMKIGPEMLLKAPEIGLVALNYLAEEYLLIKSIKEGVLALADKLGQLILIVPEPMELAGIGKIEQGIFFTREINGTTTVVAKVRTNKNSIDNLEKMITRGVAETFEEKLSANELQKLSEIHKYFQGLVDEAREVTIVTMYESRLPKRIELTRGERGALIHNVCEVALPKYINQYPDVFKGFQIFTEINIEDLANRIAQFGKRYILSPEKLAALETPTFEFIKSNPELLSSLKEAFGIKKDKDLFGLLTLEYGYTKDSLIKNMRSDAILLNKRTGYFLNLDIVSGLRNFRFQQELKKLAETAKSYREYKAGLQNLVREFGSHTVREIILRKSVLQYIFEDWNIGSGEILYNPIK